MPGEGVHAFLEAQPAIENYRIRDPRAILPQCTDTSDPEVPVPLPSHILPSLRRFWYSGNSDCIRYSLQGRIVHTVECTPTGIKNDIKRLLATGLGFESDPTQRSIPSDEIEKATVCNLSIHLWGAGDKIHLFPDVISSIYYVHLARLRSLKIETWDVLRHTDVVASALCRFPDLQWLECNGDGEADANDWTVSFVRAAAKAAPALRRVIVRQGTSATTGRVRLFSRVDAEPLCQNDCYALPTDQGRSNWTRREVNGSVAETLPVFVEFPWAWMLATLPVDGLTVLPSWEIDL